MKKFPIYFGTVLGVLLGLLSSFSDGLGLKIVMMSVGALFGVAVGGAIAHIGKKSPQMRSGEDTLAGLGVTPEDIARNYWRDKGRAPLTSPLKSELGQHQFDPDNLF